jgi:very-short-patch-repair endonuclease
MTRRVRALRGDTTDAELVLWSGLRYERLGWRFRRRHPIPPYVVDFACLEARLVIEADGGQHALPGEHQARDEVLRLAGWRLLRFWNNDIIENPTGVFETIAGVLDADGA